MAIQITKASGGPKTAEGKAAVSRNALKTGAYSAMLILPGEDESAFQELEQQFRQDFTPQDIAESAMVRELAVLTWKQLRLERIQHAVLLNAMNRPITEDDCKFKAGYRCTSRALELIEGRDLDDLRQEVSDRRKRMEFLESIVGEPTEQNLNLMAKRYPTIFDEMCEDFFTDIGQESHDKASLYKRLIEPCELDEGGPFMPYMQEWLVGEIKYSKELFVLCGQLTKFEQAIQTVKAKRIMDVMQIPLSARVYQDLQRSFFKILSELRRHQTWRRAQLIVDVTPVPSLSSGSD